MEQYTPEQIKAIKEQMLMEALLAEQQQALGDGTKANNPDAELPGTMRTPNALEKVANALGRRNNPELHDPDQDFSEGPKLTNDGTMLGDALYNAAPSSATEKIANALKGAHGVLENPYQLSGAQFAEDGYNAASEGINEEDYLKTAGGVGMMGISALPYSGGAAAKLFSSVPRSVVSGMGMSAAPLAAQDAFDASKAYAQGEKGLGEEVADKANKVGTPIGLGAFTGFLGGAGAGSIAKTLAKRESIQAQKKMADLERVGSNRVTAKSAAMNTNDDRAMDQILSDARDLEPIYYRSKTTQGLENEFHKQAQKADIKNHSNNIGTAAGALGGGATDQLVNENASLESTAAHTVAGALLGRATPSMKPGTDTPHIESKIPRYYADDSLSKIKQPTKVNKEMTMREKAMRQNRKDGKFAPGYKKDK